jgi:hypothetical protein
MTNRVEARDSARRLSSRFEDQDLQDKKGALIAPLADERLALPKSQTRSQLPVAEPRSSRRPFSVFVSEVFSGCVTVSVGGGSAYSERKIFS